MIKIEIPVRASLVHVWTSLVEETNEWWGSAHYTSPHTKKMELQEYIGGKLMEDFGNREGIVWAEVIGVKTPEFILLKGHLAPEYGGPNISYSKISFRNTDHVTILAYEETWMQKFSSEETELEIETGWRAIFEDLKQYVERNYPIS